MFNKTIHIDLNVPRAWNACTPRQLETIAAIILAHTALSDAYHPMDMFAVRSDCFFALTGLEIVSEDNKQETPAEQRKYICRKDGIKGVFPVYVWQVWSFVDKELKWIGDDKVQGLTNFVYPTYKKRHWLRRHVYDGPATLMQDFTWQRYRFAQDYMEYYVMMSNKLVRMINHPRQYSKKDIRSQQQIVRMARAQFLAVIYNRKIKHIDSDTGKTVREFAFTPSQVQDNWHDFRNFDSIKWQGILLWWSGMMQYLKRKYKRCFKRQSTKDVQPSTPLDLYTRTVATMEKYLGLDEQTVNNQNFHIVLQHMEDMAQSNEEMEKIKRKQRK